MLSRVGSVGRVGSVARRASAPVVTPLISSVEANGWQAVWAGGTPPTFDPNNSPMFQAFDRQGYDATGAAVTVVENIPFLCRVRQPFPNQASLTPSNVALGDYILSTDSAPGVTNPSTEISPKPIANWLMRDRMMVRNSVFWEIAAFHYYARNNRQVACVRVRANDGTTQTAWQAVASTAVSTYCEDAQAVEVYSGTLDVTALATGLFWLEAEVMPWIGGTASVLRSEDQSANREFSRRFFLKNVSRFDAPPLAYVASTGNDTTGVWSTTAATALATPFLTVGGAMTAMNDATRGTPATGAIMDGCEIRIVDTVGMGASPATGRSQNVANVTITRAPGTARSAAVINWGTSFRPRLGLNTSSVVVLTSPLTEGAITFFDVTINRTAAVTFIGESACQLQIRFHNVALPNSSATQFLSNSHGYFFGCTMPNSALVLDVTTGLQKRILRGVVADVNSSGVEAWVTAGCQITRPNGNGVQDASLPRIAYSNRWINPSSTGGVASWVGTVSGGNIGPIAWVQNLVEATHTALATAGFRFANDSPLLGNIVHAVIHHNTNTGYSSVNRNNFAYDEAPVARFHKFISHVGDMPAQLNTKGDIFQNDGTRLGQFAYTHGVGCRGNFTMFRTNSGIAGSEFQTFPGIGSIIGTSPDVRNDPLFTNYQGTGGSGGVPSAGAGGGSYPLQVGSPARGILAKPVLAFDALGNARPSSNDSAGAYA